MAASHEIGGLKKGKARRSDLATVRPVGSVGNEIDAELAFRRLDRRISLASRNVVTFGIQFEMMDQRFHRALHFGARRRRHFAVVDLHRASRHLRDRLLDDAHRLAHFLDADEVAVVRVPVATDRNVELYLVVSVVRLCSTEVPGNIGAAQHGSGETPIRSLLGRHYADIDSALLEDPIIGQQSLDVVYRLWKGVTEGKDVVGETGREIEMNSAGAEIIGVHACTGDALVKLHQPLAFLEAPQERGDGPDIKDESAYTEQVVQDPGDLSKRDTNVLRPGWRRDPHQFFDSERESMLLAHRRYVVEPVEIRDRLQIRLVLDQFFRAAVQQTDMRIGALDDLAVHLQNEAHHAVRRRVLWTEIHHEISDPRRAFELIFLCRALISHCPPSPGPSPSVGAALSSPGRMLSIPSQGDRKSKLRNSCCKCTGS